jgi:hypothetical protein
MNINKMSDASLDRLFASWMHEERNYRRKVQPTVKLDSNALTAAAMRILGAE